MLGLLLLWPAIWNSLSAQNAEEKETAPRQQFTQFVAEGSQALQRGDNLAAERAFREALELDPNSVQILNNLAISVARQQRETEAISLYERALHLKQSRGRLFPRSTIPACAAPAREFSQGNTFVPGA
jgi:Tfp pilus assembly protein PilF